MSKAPLLRLPSKPPLPELKAKGKSAGPRNADVVLRALPKKSKAKLKPEIASRAARGQTEAQDPNEAQDPSEQAKAATKAPRVKKLRAKRKLPKPKRQAKNLGFSS